MNQGIESITTSILSMSLDMSALRHQAIASNIANINTTGYIPLDVDFSTSLSRARDQLNTNGAISAFDLQGIKPLITEMVDASGHPVKIQLDTEMAKLAENTMNYQVLVKALSKHMSILAMAASDGKR